MSSNNLKRQLEAIPLPPGLQQRSRLGIERAMLEQQECGRRNRSRAKRRRFTIAAMLVVLFLFAYLPNRNEVWAGIQRAFQFIPGVGIVKEEDSSAGRYILAQPVTVSVGDGSVTITGVLSDEEMTYITMMGLQTRRFEEVTLVNGQGVEYTLESSTASWGSAEWTSGFWYKGNLNADGNIKLIIPAEPRVEMPLTLTRANTYTGYPEMGETATVNGVSITAIPDRVGEKARVALVAQHSEDLRIADYGITGMYFQDESRRMSVVDAQGQKLEIETIRGVSGPQSEFYFKLSDQASAGYTLTLPEISVTYGSEASIKLPTEAQDHMAYTFELAGFPVTITRTEAGDENRLRVYTDFHYKEQAAAYLYSFDIEGAGGMAKLDERTGAIIYMEFDVEPTGKYLNLKLINPKVILRGPWQFELPEGAFEAGQ